MHYDRTGNEEGTRIIVQGRWEPRELYMFLQQHGLPLRAVKQQGYQRSLLVFTECLDRELIAMIRRDILPALDPMEDEEEVSQVPVAQKLPRNQKPPFVRRATMSMRR